MLVSGLPCRGHAQWLGVCRGSHSFTAQLLRSAHSHVHFCRFDCAWRLRCVLSFACISTMGSRGTNNSLQTAPSFPIASSGEEASLQNAISLAGENVVPPTSHQASHVSLQSAGPGVAGVSPELVALISQTVQAVLAAERASASAAAIATSLSSSTAVIPSSDTPPCSVGVPDALPSLASSAASLLAAGTGFGVQSVQGRPSHSLVVPSFVSTFALPSMSSFASSASTTNVCSSQSGAIRDIAARSVGQPASLLDHPFVVGPGFSPVPAKIVAQIVAGKYVYC